MGHAPHARGSATGPAAARGNRRHRSRSPRKSRRRPRQRRRWPWSPRGTCTPPRSGCPCMCSHRMARVPHAAHFIGSPPNSQLSKLWMQYAPQRMYPWHAIRQAVSPRLGRDSRTHTSLVQMRPATSQPSAITDTAMAYSIPSVRRVCAAAAAKVSGDGPLRRRNLRIRH